MNRNSMSRNSRCKAVTGIAIALCLTVAQLDLQARPRTNDEGAPPVAADRDTSGANAQPQPTKLPASRIPRPRLSLIFPVQIPSERVTVAQATTQAGTAPPVQTGSKKKWLIIVAAVAAGVAAGVLLTRDKTEEDPVITAGAPTVGQQ